VTSCLWCIAGEPGPCCCLEDCGARPSGWLPGCPWRPGAGEWPAAAWPLGPLVSRIWAVSALLDVMDEAEVATPELEARACDRRALRGFACLLCGALARLALVSRPRWPAPLPPRWVDLCPACFSAVRREVDDYPGVFSETRDE
jgi:hypothetical protein